MVSIYNAFFFHSQKKHNEGKFKHRCCSDAGVFFHIAVRYSPHCADGKLVSYEVIVKTG